MVCLPERSRAAARRTTHKTRGFGGRAQGGRRQGAGRASERSRVAVTRVGRAYPGAPGETLERGPRGPRPHRVEERRRTHLRPVSERRGGRAGNHTAERLRRRCAARHLQAPTDAVPNEGKRKTSFTVTNAFDKGDSCRDFSSPSHISLRLPAPQPQLCPRTSPAAQGPPRTAQPTARRTRAPPRTGRPGRGQPRRAERGEERGREMDEQRRIVKRGCGGRKEMRTFGVVQRTSSGGCPGCASAASSAPATAGSAGATSSDAASSATRRTSARASERTRICPSSPWWGAAATAADTHEKMCFRGANTWRCEQ